MEKLQPYRHSLQHEQLRGDDIDVSSHQINAFSSPRIVDELVTREVGGRKVYGEIFAIVTPDALGASMDDRHPIDQLDSLCLVRYPDTYEVGIATRAKLGDEIIMHPGMILPTDKRIMFGRQGDHEGVVDGEDEVLGRVALTGVQGAVFGEGVSSIHGSIVVDNQGRVTISDGRETVDPATRHVIDASSTNYTRVSVASNPDEPRGNLLGEQKRLDRENHARKQFEELFGSPVVQPRDRFGNVKDRVSEITSKMIEDSIRSLRAVGDPEVHKIIESTIAQQDLHSPEDVIKQIRENNAIRFELAKYFKQKVDNDRDLMPDRIQRNGSKRPNHPGYSSDTIASDDYVALLAISMLDGTFNAEVSIKDKVQFNNGTNDTKINGGQHRLAALRLLGLSNGPNTPKHIDIERTNG